MKPKYTIREFFPVDGYFNLIEKDGRMIAKTFSPEDARMIIAALEKVQSC